MNEPCSKGHGTHPVAQGPPRMRRARRSSSSETRFSRQYIRAFPIPFSKPLVRKGIPPAEPGNKFTPTFAGRLLSCRTHRIRRLP